MRLVVVVALTLLVVGCASLEIESGRKLATAGVGAAATIEQAAGDSRKAVATSFDLTWYGARLGGVEREFNDKTIAAADAVQERLKKRAALAKALGATYSAFQKLAAYDAAKDMKEATAGLASAVNELSKAISGGGAISDGWSGLVTQAATAWANADQLDRMKQASELLRKILGQIKPVLAAEHKVWASNIESEIRTRYELAEVEVGQGLVNPIPYAIALTGMQETLTPAVTGPGDFSNCTRLNGSEKEREAKERAKKRATCRAVWAMTDHLRATKRRKASAASERLTSVVEALSELEKAHVEFEAGLPMTTENLEKILKLLADEAKQLRTNLEKL